jgi:4-hydroxy-tetrahydrodipicolinate synthase
MASTEARALFRNCLIPAMATPMTEDFAPDAARMAARARALLGDGADAVALFGTTGEGPHFPVAQRQSALEHIAAAGLPPDRLIVAANAVALADVISLARHAVAIGAAAVLLMPPFFLRGATSEAGVERFYDAVIAACSDPRLRVILYHFPDISGFAFTPPLIRRLVARHGPAIVGIKDSGGDWAVTGAFIGEFPELAVMTGTEVHIHRVIDAGGAGTICGLGNVMPRLLRRLLDRPALADQLVPSIQAMDDALSAHPFVPACKAVIAELTGDATWRRVMPPLSPLAEPQRFGLLDRVRDLLALTQGR